MKRTPDQSGRPDARDVAAAEGNGQSRPQFLEIDLGRSRRWAGLAGYVLLFLSVCTLLVVLFLQFTASLRLALILVVGMVAYMLLMGWWASGKLERREDDEVR